MGKNLINILLLPRESYPTTRIHLTELFEKEMTKRGHNIFWIMEPKEKNNKLKTIRMGKNIFYLVKSSGTKTKFQNLVNLRYLIQKYQLAKKCIENNDIDLIVTTDGIIEGIISIYLSRKYNIPFSFYLTSLFWGIDKENFKANRNLINFVKFIRGLISQKIFSYIIFKADLFQPISKWMGEYYKEYFPTKNVFPSPMCGIDLFLNNRYKKRENIEGINKNKILIYIGQISSIRKLDFLIRVLKMIYDKNKNNQLKLMMIGPPQEKEIIEKLKIVAKKFKIEEEVIFIDEIPREDIPIHLTAAQIGVSALPPILSYKVSSPTKAIEYLSLGIPTVVNREVYDQKEIIEESGGGFAVKYDENEFAEAIIWLLEHPIEAKEMGKRGREWIKENRTYEKLAKNLEEKYYEIINRGLK